jgi:hypothetical protein
MAQVYATILYYLENQKTVGKYVGDWLEYASNMKLNTIAIHHHLS